MSDDYYMLSWSGRRVNHEHMLVMRRVAVQMMTGIIEENRVTFSHELCEGMVERGKQGSFVGGGVFFFGDFGEHDGSPHTVDFFIPRRAAFTRYTRDSIITCTTNGPNGIEYPEDIDGAKAFGGKLRITTVRP
jgi:hypothetical protein